MLAVLLLSAPCAFGQPTVVPDDRLPPDSIELKRNDPPVTSTPWQLPKPGDPLYDTAKEAQIGLLASSSGSLIPSMIGHIVMDIGLFAY